MKSINQFYIAYGVNKTGQLLHPPMPRLERLQLPRQSIVHYDPISLVDQGPSLNHPLLARTTRPPRVKHIFELVEKNGNPRRINEPVGEIARQYKKKNPRMRIYVDETTALREPESVLVVNYAPLASLYRYQRHRMSPWYKLSNRFATVLSEIKEFEGKGFNQFLEITIPDSIPKASVMTLAESKTNPIVYVTFANQTLFTLLEFWTWLGPNRETSLIHKYFPEGFKDLYLIFRESDRFSVISTMKLQQWRKATSEEAMRNALANRKGTDPEALQRRLLRLMLSIAELRTSDLPENMGDDVVEVVDSVDKTTTKDGVIIDGSVDTVIGTPEDDAFQEVLTQDLDVMEEFGAEIDEMEKVQDPDGELETNSEGDILEQQAINEERAKPFPSDPKDVFLRLAAKLADEGDISAGDYRRATEAVREGKQAYVGDQPLEEYVKITPEQLKIEPKQICPDHSAIIDKSMLKTTLVDFDKKYVREIMQKDIAGMVHNLMGAGIQITSYSAVEVNQPGGDHFEYTVSLKPLRGKPSTIRFKIPKINDEGKYYINGIPFVVRKQRSDLPIRMMTPSRVALSSYYGRVFVDRSEKRVNDYGKWLANRVFLLGSDRENTTITEMECANCFDRTQKTPRLFSALAKTFSSFVVDIPEHGKFKCIFNQKERKVFEELDKSRLSPNCIVLGTGPLGEILEVNFNNELFINSESAPRLEELIGLNPIKAPVEFSICGVLGQEIPVGLVLAYVMGFTNLCRLLKVEPRRVPVGKRLNLALNEWAIAFEDQTLVFDRNDRLATMVLGGIREFHRSLASFPYAEFDHPDVYLSVLEERKLGARYLREIELLEAMFVDPITKGLLEQMKEPVVFRELLIRSSEMLLTEDHQEENDFEFMRMKGYERMSGILYDQLVSSVRAHNNRIGSSRYGIELKPYAVWMAIQEDSAKDQVSDINPIQDLKQQEAVTLSGEGGRTSRTIVAKSRKFHKNDMGTTSEATHDSGDAGASTYLSANPKFNSLRGTSDRWNLEEDGITSLLSTSAMTSIGALRDD